MLLYAHDEVLEGTHVHVQCHVFCVLLNSPPLQWKNAAKSELMDSKLRCVFEEGEPASADTTTSDDPSQQEQPVSIIM